MASLSERRRQAMANSVTIFAPSGAAYTRKLGVGTQGELSPGAEESIYSGLENLVGSYNRAYGQAKTANEQRYQQMLGIAGQDYQRTAGIDQSMLNLAGTTTGQREADIRSEYAGQSSNIMQSLARLGMGNTTVAPTMQMGVKREEQSALNRLADEMLGTRLGIMGTMAGRNRGTELGIMERKTDAYPDQSALMEAFKSLGSGYGESGTAAMANMLSQMKF